jgi:hypothetical protein
MTEPLSIQGNLIMRGPEVVAMIMRSQQAEDLARLFVVSEDLAHLVREALEHGVTDRWRDAAVVRCVGSNAEVYSPKIRFRSLDHAKVWARAFVRFAPPEQWLTVLIEGPGTLIRWRIRPPGT